MLSCCRGEDMDCDESAILVGKKFYKSAASGVASAIDRERKQLIRKLTHRDKELEKQKNKGTSSQTSGNQSNETDANDRGDKSAPTLNKSGSEAVKVVDKSTSATKSHNVDSGYHEPKTMNKMDQNRLSQLNRSVSSVRLYERGSPLSMGHHKSKILSSDVKRTSSVSDLGVTEGDTSFHSLIAASGALTKQVKKSCETQPALSSKLKDSDYKYSTVPRNSGTAPLNRCKSNPGMLLRTDSKLSIDGDVARSSNMRKQSGRSNRIKSQGDEHASTSKMNRADQVRKQGDDHKKGSNHEILNRVKSSKIQNKHLSISSTSSSASSSSDTRSFVGNSVVFFVENDEKRTPEDRKNNYTRRKQKIRTAEKAGNVDSLRRCKSDFTERLSKLGNDCSDYSNVSHRENLVKELSNEDSCNATIGEVILRKKNKVQVRSDQPLLKRASEPNHILTRSFSSVSAVFENADSPGNLADQSSKVKSSRRKAKTVAQSFDENQIDTNWDLNPWSEDLRIKLQRATSLARLSWIPSTDVQATIDSEDKNPNQDMIGENRGGKSTTRPGSISDLIAKGMRRTDSGRTLKMVLRTMDVGLKSAVVQEQVIASVVQEKATKELIEAEKKKWRLVSDHVEECDDTALHEEIREYKERNTPLSSRRRAHNSYNSRKASPQSINDVAPKDGVASKSDSKSDASSSPKRNPPEIGNSKTDKMTRPTSLTTFKSENSPTRKTKEKELKAIKIDDFKDKLKESTKKQITKQNENEVEIGKRNSNMAGDRHNTKQRDKPLGLNIQENQTMRKSEAHYSDEKDLKLHKEEAHKSEIILTNKDDEMIKQHRTSPKANTEQRQRKEKSTSPRKDVQTQKDSKVFQSGSTQQNDHLQGIQIKQQRAQRQNKQRQRRSKRRNQTGQPVRRSQSEKPVGGNRSMAATSSGSAVAQEISSKPVAGNPARFCQDTEDKPQPGLLRRSLSLGAFQEAFLKQLKEEEWMEGRGRNGGRRGMKNQSQASVQMISNANNGKSYSRGRLLGKGGFAKCVELTDIISGETVAAKVVTSGRMLKHRMKERIEEEAELHRQLNHVHIVQFLDYFEFEGSAYLLLENCTNQTLVHMLSSRKTLTEPEVRFYMHQLIEGCSYLHSLSIIHRDLKLANMLLAADMSLKIADFGLATRIQYIGEKKRSVCGTPNYIAPEVLQKVGHSYEADIWSIGCIMYTLLCGQPPFDTCTVRETYQRILACRFTVPSHLPSSARVLIESLLVKEPSQRAGLEDIRTHAFMTGGYCPTSLPPSACCVEPRFSLWQQLQRKELFNNSNNNNNNIGGKPSMHRQLLEAAAHLLWTTSSPSLHRKSPRQSSSTATTISSGFNTQTIKKDSRRILSWQQWLHKGRRAGLEPASGPSRVESDLYDRLDDHAHTSLSTSLRSVKIIPSVVKDSARFTAERLYVLLDSCFSATLNMPHDPHKRPSLPAPVPQPQPVCCVVKWVDYTNMYGFGFQLSDRRVGILFNDSSRMLLDPETKTVFVKESSKSPHLANNNNHTPSSTPSADHQEDLIQRYHKRLTLVLYFAQYMKKHLISSTGSAAGAGKQREADNSVEVKQSNTARGKSAVFLLKWHRDERAILLLLSDGTLQVNSFSDHTKLILTPNGKDYIVTLMSRSSTETRVEPVTYRLSDLVAASAHLQAASGERNQTAELSTSLERLKTIMKYLHVALEMFGEIVQKSRNKKR